MKRLVHLLFLFFFTALSHAQPARTGQRFVILPDSLVQQMLSSAPAEQAELLLKEAASLTGEPLHGNLIHSLQANLDKDPEPELLLLLGGVWNSSHFGVIDRQQGQWVLLYLAPAEHNYETLSIQVFSLPETSPLFGHKLLETWGSGVFKEVWLGYRLLEGRVYPCLRVPTRAHIYGWGLNLNQVCLSQFGVEDPAGEFVEVICHYHFFPGAWLEGNLPWEGNEHKVLAKGSAHYLMMWDSLSYQYAPAFNSNDEFNETSLLATEEFGSDSLFLAGFAKQITEGLESGDREQRRLVRAYLDRAAEGAEGVQLLGETSGMKFYGTGGQPGKPRRKKKN